MKDKQLLKKVRKILKLIGATATTNEIGVSRATVFRWCREDKIPASAYYKNEKKILETYNKFFS